MTGSAPTISLGLGATPARGRYAPSPTGLLHLGNARTALLAWLQIRALGGTFVMRIEDLDTARSLPGRSEAMLEDLRWLGLDWDEGPYFQSDRTALYEAAIENLRAKGHLYPCYCSRAEIAAAASAPHASEEGPRYPGTCRTRATPPDTTRKPALRFRAPPGPTHFIDGLVGAVVIDVEATVGDFVIQRGDGVAAYQLAVAVDDAAMGITHVLRGDDLLTSTPRQLQLLDALGLPAPAYLHVPLLLGPDGHRLSKRAGDTALAWFREQGVPPECLVAALARSAGLTDAEAITPRELIPLFDPARLRRTAAPFVLAPSPCLKK